MQRSKFPVVLAAITTALSLVMITPSTGIASTWPSGQRMTANTSFDGTHFVGGGGTIEPAFNDANGTLTYLLTPNNAKVNPNDHNVAPIYLPVYPAGSGIDAATLSCAHVPADNCPDHGPLIAGAAMQIDPGVYSGGVLGHDHLVGIAKTDGDFNIIWEPVLVLFTNAAAARNRLMTLTDINNAVSSHNAFLVPIPQADFHCSVVPESSYAKATPAPTVVGP